MCSAAIGGAYQVPQQGVSVTLESHRERCARHTEKQSQRTALAWSFRPLVPCKQGLRHACLPSGNIKIIAASCENSAANQGVGPGMCQQASVVDASPVGGDR